MSDPNVNIGRSQVVTRVADRPSMAFGRPALLVTTLAAVLGCYQIVAAENPVTTAATQKNSCVTLDQIDGKWQLQRNGQPYKVIGGGGPGDLKELANAGANSARIWGIGDTTVARLDEAHRNGISVALGIWLEHERHEKIDYDNAQQVEEQAQLFLSHVRNFKDHPALLVWGIGNEMEGDGSKVAIWKHVEDLAQRVKQLDPHHPTMTVIAEMGDTKIQSIHEHCPSIDIVGINSYGGSRSVPKRYRENGGTKPYIVTEFGPIGTWEVGKNNFDAIQEPSTAAKALMYRGAYQNFQADEQLCLGSYAFLWGSKQEGTATWFGMLTPAGLKTSVADTMQELWSGTPPANHSPVIESLAVEGNHQFLPGAELHAKLKHSDAERDSVSVRWILMKEAESYVTGGDFQKTPEEIQGACTHQTSDGALVKLPSKEGIYRLYVFVEDETHRNAASSNLPLLVTQSPAELVASPESAGTVKLPLVVFDEGLADEGKYAASGLMGDVQSVTTDDRCTLEPKSGKHCLRIKYDNPVQWAGLVWQHPANDWGELPGGYDLSGASKLTFWAKGNAGGEKMKFGYGLLGDDKPHADSAKQEIEVTLTAAWKEYSLPCEGDLRQIKSGFYWSLAGQGKPVEFFLDRIRYQ